MVVNAGRLLRSFRCGEYGTRLRRRASRRAVGIIELAPLDFAIRRSFDAQTDTITAYAMHHDRDGIADANRLTSFSRKNQHPYTSWESVTFRFHADLRDPLNRPERYIEYTCSKSIIK